MIKSLFFMIFYVSIIDISDELLLLLKLINVQKVLVVNTVGVSTSVMTPRARNGSI